MIDATPPTYVYHEYDWTEHFDASSHTEAMAWARDHARDGEYGEVTETIWVDVWVSTIAEDDDPLWESGPISVAIEPDEPTCEDGDEHEWGELSVTGSGGGVLISDVCLHCGLLRTTDTWAHNRVTGEEGLTRVAYAPGDDLV